MQIDRYLESQIKVTYKILPIQKHLFLSGLGQKTLREKQQLKNSPSTKRTCRQITLTGGM